MLSSARVSVGSQIPSVRLVVKADLIKSLNERVRNFDFARIDLAENPYRVLSLYVPSDSVPTDARSASSGYCSVTVKAGARCRFVHFVRQSGGGFAEDYAVNFSATPAQVSSSVFPDLVNLCRNLLREEAVAGNMMEGYVLHPVFADKYRNRYVSSKIQDVGRALSANLRSLSDDSSERSFNRSSLDVFADSWNMDSKGVTVVLPRSRGANALAFRMLSSCVNSNSVSGVVTVSVVPGAPVVVGVMSGTNFTNGFVTVMENVRVLMDEYLYRVSRQEVAPAESVMRNIDEILASRPRQHSGESVVQTGAGLWTAEDLHFL